MADNDNPNRNPGVVGPIAEISDRDGEDIVYIPGPEDPPVARWRGLQFEAGVPLIVRNKWHLDAARGNRHFVVGPLSDEDKKRLDEWRKANEKGK
jgi:hypothetical protein